MTTFSDNGTAPYTRFAAAPEASNAGDSPLQYHFINDLKTGIGYPAQNAFTLISNGVELGRVSGIVFSCPQFFAEGVVTQLSANTGSAAGATLLSAANNFVSASASNGGVLLPQISSFNLPAGTSTSVVIFNDSGSTIRVYAHAGDTIDGLPADHGVPLSSLKRCMYITKTATAWVSAQMGAISA